tara:strand:+ start:454 stop:621 length:168 start_codon:yes stop_codon:yes gene_type:complete
MAQMLGLTEQLAGGGSGGGGGKGRRASYLQMAGETVIVQNRDDAVVGDGIAEVGQ